MVDNYRQELRKFVAPEFIFGVGALHQAGRYARNVGMSRVLLVTDPGVRVAGWTQKVADALTGDGISYVLFDGISPNPKDFEVKAGAALYKAERCDGIVAVGGGSPMDCAKGIGVVATNGGSILDFEGVDAVGVPPPPLLCIPTTAGTAADVSQFAIISDVANKNKIAIISKAIVPDVALIDPATTTTMDPLLTACTGMDALVHGIEAFVSNANSPITDIHALEAIRLVSQNLTKVMSSPNDLSYRTNMMLGCLEAGLAFSNASLGAVHAMAHSLGGLLDLPHGQCNALLLDSVMAFNYPAAPERYGEIAKALGLDVRGMNSQAICNVVGDEVRRLRSVLGIGDGLKGIGVQTSDVPVLSEKASADPCLVTNPRQANRRDIEVIYGEAF